MEVEPVWTNTSISQRILPLLASRQSARREGLPFSSGIAVVTYRRPRRKIGEDQPRPGTSARQTIFEELLQLIGTFRALEIPWPPGPRNCGQSSAVTAPIESLRLLCAFKRAWNGKQRATTRLRRKSRK